MIHLRQIIRRLITESFTQDIAIPDPPSESLQELEYVISQYQNRYNPESLQQHLDTNMESLFDQVLQNAGYDSQKEKILALKEDKTVEKTIMDLKNSYKRPRPDEVAMMFGVDWKGDGIRMTTDDTYSYPSGHACQAYYIALGLSLVFPSVREYLLEVANMVAQSRIDRGVHFLSDIEAGKLLAYKLHKALMHREV